MSGVLKPDSTADQIGCGGFVYVLAKLPQILHPCLIARVESNMQTRTASLLRLAARELDDKPAVLKGHDFTAC